MKIDPLVILGCKTCTHSFPTWETLETKEPLSIETLDQLTGMIYVCSMNWNNYLYAFSSPNDAFLARLQ